MRYYFTLKEKRFWEDDSVESTRNLFLHTANNYRVCLMLTTLESTEDLQLPCRGLHFKLGYQFLLLGQQQLPTL